MKVVPATALVVICLLQASAARAFRSTDFESFTDPDFVGYKPTRVVAVVSSGDFQLVRQIESRLKDALGEYGVEVVSSTELFPPTRPLESYDLFGTLAARQIDSALLITPGASSSNVFQAGSSSQTTVRSFGNQATAQTTTTPNVVVHSSAQFTVQLLALGNDRETTRTAWYAQVSTQAGGTLFVGKKGDAKGAVRGIQKGLLEDGHLPKSASTDKTAPIPGAKKASKEPFPIR